MNKKLSVTKIETIFTEDIWDEVIIDHEKKIMKPKYMVQNFNYKDINDFDSLNIPYVKIELSNNEITLLEAQPGIIRNLPLFYTVVNDVLFLSDSPKNFVNENTSFDELSIQEFLTYGYVTSDRTLLHNVYSLEAGEKINYQNQTVDVSTKFLYNSGKISKTGSTSLKAQLRNISDKIFNDLIVTLKGKTALVPLSAGYDSRFIVSMLKLGGFEDVVCFAWGKPANEDINISKKIAEKLGYKWISIDYSEKSWENAINAEWFDSLIMESTGFVSTSGAASFPFQKYLRDNFDLENCVLLPGHTGDFIGGGHIPQPLKLKTKKHDLVEYIQNKHFVSAKEFDDKKVTSELKRQIDNYSLLIDDYRIFETWEWRERQSKFIANTNRFYEAMGLAWNMPLWNPEYVKFWEGVPLSQKKNLKIYYEFLEEVIFKEAGVDFSLKKKKKKKNSLKNKVFKSLLKKFPQLFSRVQDVRMKNRAKSDEFGFHSSLPYLYELAELNNPNGFKKMNYFCEKYKMGIPISQYDFLSRSMLARLFEEVKH